QQRIPNSLFRRKHRPICCFAARKDSSLRLIDSPMRRVGNLQARQKIPGLPTYSRMFDRALIFRCLGLLNICEVFARRWRLVKSDGFCGALPDTAEIAAKVVASA